MKTIFLNGLLLFSALSPLMAQQSLTGHFYGEDALKFSRYNTSGSARVSGMGGAFSALGGDLSNANANPAGLGFYNKSEFGMTLLLSGQNTVSTYIDNKTSLNASNVKIGQIGAAFSSNGTGTRKKRSTWGISYHTLVNFSNEYNYQGSNKRSSLTDYFAQKASARGVSSKVLEDEFDTSTKLAQTSTSMFYNAFLIDPMANNGGFISSEGSVPVEQSGRVSESGGLGQFTISYGANFDDKTYIGASLGIQSLNYYQTTEHAESFPNGDIFNSFRFGEDLVVNGSGLNASLGAIVKVSEAIRIGANIISPTAISIKETITSNVSINQKANTFKTNYPEIGTVPNDWAYSLTSPLRGNLGMAFFLPKKMGVINIETEYVGYSMMNLKNKEDTRWAAAQKSDIQNEFKNVLNLKAGGEIRKGTGRFRAGVNYLGSPRRNTNATNTESSLVGSVGLGVRNAKFYADVAFSKVLNKSSFTPYTVSNSQDYASAALNSSKNIVGISFGTFF
jgi:hypothetical protein